jgi:UDP-N-acetylmuramate--alanine ligase
LIITDVYAARETPLEGITGKIIADEAIRNGHPSVDYIANIKDVVPLLMEEDRIKSGDIAITMGAGDVWKVADELVGRLRDRN